MVPTARCGPSVRELEAYSRSKLTDSGINRSQVTGVTDLRLTEHRTSTAKKADRRKRFDNCSNDYGQTDVYDVYDYITLNKEYRWNKNPEN